MTLFAAFNLLGCGWLARAGAQKLRDGQRRSAAIDIAVATVIAIVTLVAA